MMLNAGKKYSCVVIDDEFSSINLLKEYLSQIPKLELFKSYLNPVLALKELKKGKNLIFFF